MRQGEVPVAPRVAVAGVVGALLFGVLMLRLWALTVLGGAEYAERADRNQLRLLPVQAPRGEILDRRGQPIVTNRPARQVVIDLQQAGDEAQLDAILSDLSRPLGVPLKELRARVAKAPPGALEPVVLVEDVPTREDYKVWWLAEHEADFPGVRVEIVSKRKYTNGKLAAHLLGFVGLVSPEELEGSYSNLEPNDVVGKAGLERTYDQYLRGANGYQAVQVDAAGQRQGNDGRGMPATPGRDLQTTIDLKLQKAAEQSLVKRINLASKTSDGAGAFAGAVVVMDVKTGGILAMASAPTYDPAMFGDPERQDEVRWLYNLKNKKQPGLNRAIAGAYAPASTYKVISAMAAMEERITTPTRLIPCPPSVEILKQVFRNHETTHLGSIELSTALETSCDTYFYELAMYFYNDPGTPLQNWSRKFGLGAPTGLDIGGEASGLIPDKTWLKSTFGQDAPWYPGYTVNMSIGQGDLTVTPLQMTNVYATIANGGTMHTPHIGQAIREASGKQALKLTNDKPKDLELNPVYLDAIKSGLEKVANGPNGTASGVFATFPIRTAGKSGTGEVLGKKDLAWYCGYAPADKPEIATCGFIDGGGGGSSSAGPIVRDVFESYFAKRIRAMRDPDASRSAGDSEDDADEEVAE